MKKIIPPPSIATAVAAMLFFNVLFPLIKGGEGDVLAQSGEKWSFGLNSPSGNAAFGTSNYFPIIIKTNSTEKMRITESGNVGIGTIAPADKLHVAGTARMLNAEVENQLNALNVTAQNANFAVALVTGQLSAGSLTVSGNATVNGQLSVVSGQLMLGSNLSMDGNNSTIISSSGNISLGNNDLSTTGNINSANISALQTTDSIFNSQFSILNSQVNSIQSSQWTTTQNGIEHNGNVFVKNLSVEESINIGSFRFSNGSKDTAIAPPPVIKDTIASDKSIVISAEKNISLNADTVFLGNGTGKVGIGIPPAPGEKLSVAGNVGVSGNLRLSSLTGTGDRVIFVDANGNLKVTPSTQAFDEFWRTDGNVTSGHPYFLGTTDAADLIVKTNNTEAMRVTAGGNVGIGTNNPQKRLHIWQTDINNPTCSASLRIEYDVPQVVNGCETIAHSTWDLNAQGDNVLTITNPSLPQPAMTFLEDGNVGIGTTNPQAKIEISQANPHLPALLIKKDIMDTVQQIAVLNTAFEVQNTALGNYDKTLFIVKDSGNVGVGITTPQAKLEVQLETQGSGLLNEIVGSFNKKLTTQPNPRKIFFVPHLSGAGFNNISQNDDAGIFWTDGLASAGHNNRAGLIIAPWDGGIISGIKITNTGGVGIGTGNPQHKLDVYGGTAYFDEKVSIGVPDNNLTNINNTTGLPYKLYVAGGIMTERCKIALQSNTNEWGDWVFDKNNKRMTFEEQWDYYMKYKHLKWIPSKNELKKNGLDVTELFTGVVINLEEVRLDAIQLYKENQEQQAELNELKNQVKQQQKEIKQLKKEMEQLQKNGK